MRAKAAKKYREDCIVLLRSQHVPRVWTDQPITLRLTFCPPTRRHADLDNLLSRTKHGVDAIAQLMGVNDKVFEFNLRRGEPVKGGKVIVTIGEMFE